MRQPKPSDVQALEVFSDRIKHITVHLTHLNSELIKTYKSINEYLKEQTDINIEALNENTKPE
jgi:hypothetical protein